MNTPPLFQRLTLSNVEPAINLLLEIVVFKPYAILYQFQSRHQQKD
jgi:hypothetical protein